MELVNAQEISIVNRAYDTHLLKEICEATGLKTHEICPINFETVKDEKARALIKGCKKLLMEDFKDLRDLLH